MKNEFPDGTRSVMVAVDGGAKVTISRVLLLIESGPDKGLEVSLGERPWVLGRGEAADLRLKDDTVSRAHIRLEPHDDGWKIVDLESKGGTWLNEVKVERAVLPADVAVRIGKTEFVLRRDAVTLHAEPAVGPEFRGLRTECTAMRRIFGTLSKLAPLELPVLLIGESGTGKERLARALHELSPRSERSYEVVDCTLLDREHIRSELFGHVKGAFTGATGDRKGAFERADGGTLFLDEIGEIPLELQPTLLRVLEEGEVRPLGGDKSKQVRVRVVAATNRDLGKMAAEGQFRLDLYHRLSALEVAVPPLRAREGDVGLLANHFLGEGLKLTADAAEVLRRHPWPGNIRELRNRIARASALAEGGRVTAEDLGLSQGGPWAASASSEIVKESGVVQAPPRKVEELIQDAIRESMARHSDNRSAVCEELGISRATLYRKLKAMNLE